MGLFGFPNAVFFIIGNEFCERFSFYGMKAILIIYLTNYLYMSPNTAVALAHGFNMVCYGTPLLGALIADSYWGKFKTIMLISIVYSIGNLVMSLTAIPQFGAGPHMWYGPMVGLLLIGIGTGGIKPCVAAFGGDQFSDGNESKIGTFFSMFYFSINAGSVVSMLLTPILRADVGCFGEITCYPLAFGVPAILMIIAVGFFILGDVITKYKKNPPEGNIFGDVVRCVCYALKRKFRSGADQWRRHWLDWADDKYSNRLIADIKVVFNVMTVLIPIVIFWALFDQQGTRWTLQAQRLDGMNFIKPDQMQVLNAVLILLFIPIFDQGIYPLCNKFGLRMRPLQRLGIGLLLTSGSFVISGFLELQLEDQDLHPPMTGHGFITVINHLDEPLDVRMLGKPYTVPAYQMMEGERIRVELNHTVKTHGSTVTKDEWAHFDLTFAAKNSGDKIGETLIVDDRKGVIAVVLREDGTLMVKTIVETIEKPPDAKTWINLFSSRSNLTAVKLDEKNSDSHNMTTKLELEPGFYKFKINDNGTEICSPKNDFKNGGTYTVVFHDGAGLYYTVYTNTKENEFSMLWQVPQYVVMTMAEIMVSITGLSFAYSQGPDSMKSVMQAGWLFTTFLGNAIDLVVAASQTSGDATLSHSAELFLFAGLCFLAFLLFLFLAARYNYVDEEEEAPFDAGSKIAPSTESGNEMEMSEVKRRQSNGTVNPVYED